MQSKNFINHLIIIAILSVFSGVMYNLFSKNRIPLLHEPLMIDPGKNISINQAYQLYQETNAVFIDTRDEEEYMTSHIKNAINIPAHSSIEELVLLKEKYPADQLIITYCDGVECSSSKRLAAILLQIGFQNILVFYGGWQEWQEKEYPVEEISPDAAK
jgi:rhodanese-related sulfurtransferase